MRKPLAMAIAILAVAATSTAQAGQGRSQHSYRMTVLQTAYCLQGRTATGTYVHWGAVATDPRVIPLGTRMWVPGYGAGRAEDTGGAIWGHHIDVWVPSCSQAMRMTRYVTITVYR